jgi:hypothetical protein
MHIRAKTRHQGLEGLEPEQLHNAPQQLANPYASMHCTDNVIVTAQTIVMTGLHMAQTDTLTLHVVVSNGHIQSMYVWPYLYHHPVTMYPELLLLNLSHMSRQSN